MSTVLLKIIQRLLFYIIMYFAVITNWFLELICIIINLI